MEKINLGGRPPHYETPEQLLEAINDYIQNPPTRSVYVDGDEVKIPCYTLTGLALHLGFESKQSIYDYEKREPFSYLIKKAKLFIESQYEKKLHEPQCTGSIFVLKNMGWSDKQEVEHSGSEPIGNIKIEVVGANGND